MPDRLIGGRYKIVRKLAEGGMGEVFEAQHNLSKKKVALKILFPHIGKDEAARQRFLREVSAPAQIGHEGIVEVYDAGFDTQDGSLFVAMEFIDGEPLRDRLARGGVGLGQLLDWFEEMLDPLAAAHASGIVHRDLKPENAMLAKKRDGEKIKLLDFGIARDLDASQNNVTHTGIAMGTPHYMAPEQAMSAKGVSAAADVWAMGVMLYEALSGRTPFDGETPSAIVVHACTQAHASLLHVAPHVPPPLAAFVDRCLQKDPSQRPRDAGAMLAELRQVRAQIGGAAAGPNAPAAGMAYQNTGPMAGMQPTPYPTPHPSAQPHTPIPTPKGTAVLPSSQLPAPGGYATPPPTGGGWASPAPGSSPGHYGTPPPYGSSPGGAFATPAPPSAPGGYGTSGGFSAPGSYGAPTGYAQPSSSGGGGGMALGIVAAVLLGGLVLVGGGIAGAVWLLSGDDDGGDGPTWTSTGRVTLSTDVPAGELRVDGSSRGVVRSGQVLEIEGGAHRFELVENGQVVSQGTLTVQAGQPHTLTLNRVAAPQQPPPRNDPNVMIPGDAQTFRGQLRPGDLQLPDGKYYDVVTVNWTAGQRVRVDLDSTDMDTYLIIRAPSGAEQSNDDRGDGSLNSALDLTVAESGTYTIMATTFSPHTTGDYTLTIRGGGGGGGGGAPVPGVVVPAGTQLTIGTPSTVNISGARDPASSTYFELAITRGGTYTCDAVSQGDPVMAIVQNGNVLAQDDDGGEGLNSRITYGFGPGNYQIRLWTFSGSPAQVTVTCR